jgi:hypothetical protein
MSSLGLATYRVWNPDGRPRLIASRWYMVGEGRGGGGMRDESRRDGHGKQGC